MKRLIVITGSVLFVFLLATLFSTPSQAVKNGNNPTSAVKAAIPDSVSKILEKSCYPCHSEPGKGMALAHVNFDKWADLKPEKQADKAEDICKQLSKGSMPPKSFRKNNPDKVPTDAEVKTVCNWAGSFGSK